MDKRKRSRKLRLITAQIIMTLIGLYLIFRIGVIQYSHGDEYKKEAYQQWSKTSRIKANRGLIFDRNGKRLAIVQTKSDVWIDPQDIDEDKVQDITDKLSMIFPDDRERIYEIASKERGSEKLKSNIKKEIGDQVRELKLYGVRVEDKNTRYYPYENFLAHVLGFTNSENVGSYGLEGAYNDYLSGTSGLIVGSRDRKGRRLPFEKTVHYKSNDGLSLVTTIDENIQRFVEMALNQAIEENNAENIACIVMDPRNGDILAMSSKPDYNPNNPNEETAREKIALEKEGLTDEEKEKIRFDKWRNFNINDLYEPGSTFKLITAASALEESKVNPNTPFRCTGAITDMRGVRLRCFKAHGNIDLKTGIEKSCNTVSVWTARYLGKENFYKYIKAFGFGELSGISLNGEEKGIIPSSAESISDVNLATMSYGHSISVTPIQLTTAISAIVNGGDLYRPRLVSEVIDNNGNIQRKIEPHLRRKVISKSTSDELLKMMELVVENGTGRNAKIEGYRIGGKTGTANKIVDGRYKEGAYIGSFIGVAPINDPKMVILVVVDEPEGFYNGGLVAAPIARNILEDSLEYLKVPKVGQEEENNKDFVELPDFTGMTLEEAGSIIFDLGLRYSTDYDNIDEGLPILSQSILPGSFVAKKTIVDLYLKPSLEEEIEFVEGQEIENQDELIDMPDLIGKTKEEVIEVLDQLGLEYFLIGDSGKAVYQYPLAGGKINKKLKVEVEFE